MKPFADIPPSLASDLHRRAGAALWGISPGEFAAALNNSAANRFTSDKDVAALRKYLEGLHLEDLALAIGCRRGNQPAWEHFVEHYRPRLRSAARLACGDESRGHELADSLYADLFGLAGGEGERKSLFDYFHGRSSLMTWLRAVVAQRVTDQWRRESRLDALDGRERAPDPGGDTASEPDPDRLKYLKLFSVALHSVLGNLHATERMLLAHYYLDQLTLAQIGRILAEHESSVSRRLDRLRKGIRSEVEKQLRGNHGLNDEQITLCYNHSSSDWPFDLAAALAEVPEHRRGSPEGYKKGG